MDHPSSANDNNSNLDFNYPNDSNLDSDLLGSQFEVPPTNNAVPSTNPLSSQIDGFK